MMYNTYRRNGRATNTVLAALLLAVNIFYGGKWALFGLDGFDNTRGPLEYTHNIIIRSPRPQYIFIVCEYCPFEFIGSNCRGTRILTCSYSFFR